MSEELSTRDMLITTFAFEAPLQMKKLGDVADLINGDRGKNYPNDAEQTLEGYCLFLSTKNVLHGQFDFTDARFITQEKHNMLSGGTLKRGDIVLTIRGTLGNSAVYDEMVQYDVVRINSAMIIVRPKPGMNPYFIMWALRSPALMELVGESARGSAQPHLRAADIREMLIPAPPIAEQRRIVAKLDALFARSQRARAELERVPQLVERTKQAVLAAAFSGELTRDIDQAEFALHSLDRFIQSTFYGPRFAKTSYTTDGVLTLRTTDFADSGDIVLNSPPTVQVSKSDMAKWGLIDGDVLVTRTGSIGKCAVYSENIGPALPSAYLIRVRLDTELIDPHYCLFFLLSKDGQDQLGSGITAVTQPNINASVIRGLRLPVPAVPIQRRIIARIEAAFARIDRMAAEAARATALLDRLEQATLAKAFRGELLGAEIPEVAEDAA